VKSAIRLCSNTGLHSFWYWHRMHPSNQLRMCLHWAASLDFSVKRNVRHWCP